ncbi:hypothetical protein [Bifidobacterium ruminantium]|uniref:Uncharacterized protein n=1 Tax=Bifidobacterium ruminantium TaxID=78346 RepID=A0A087CY78_BIFRU|nr:hypothetical protein [Bifidobacterium ruminantium]KFI88228.1 hypothetical protein BRUM_1644 [Bifidobacterium ruminantium]MEE0972277.1 hypothetical protein [Bifidobacterium ruminantium]
MSIDTQAYLFVHFIGEERNPTDEQLYFAPSGNRQRGHREIGIDDIAVIPRAGHSCHVGGSGIEIGGANGVADCLRLFRDWLVGLVVGVVLLARLVVVPVFLGAAAALKLCRTTN